MSILTLEKRLARLERQRPAAEAAALFLLEDEDDELPAWAASAPIRAVLDLREPADRPAANREEVVE